MVRITPVNLYQATNRINNNNNNNNNVQKPIMRSQPQFGSFYNDLDDDTSTSGYSILDLFKWLRGGKPSISKAEEEDFRQTWDPELGDISQFLDPYKVNVDTIADYESGKLDEQIKQAKEQRAREREKAMEPPSILIYHTNENDD